MELNECNNYGSETCTASTKVMENQQAQNLCHYTRAVADFAEEGMFRVLYRIYTTDPAEKSNVTQNIWKTYCF